MPSTHRKIIARQLARTGQLSYSESLRRVRAAAERGVLPATLDDDGVARAVRTLLTGIDPAPNGRTTRIVLGFRGDGSSYTIDEAELACHMLIVGETCAESTFVVADMVTQLIDAGWTGTVIDPRDDAGPGGLCESTAAAARRAGREFSSYSTHHQVATGPYDPLAGLTPAAATQAILTAVPYGGGYWDAVAQRVIGPLVAVLDTAHHAAPDEHPPVSTQAIVDALSVGQLADRTAGAVEVATQTGADLDTVSLTNPTIDEKVLGEQLGVSLHEQLSRLPQHAANGPDVRVGAAGITYIGVEGRAQTLVVSAAVSAVAYPSQPSGGAAPRRFLAVTEVDDVPWAVLSDLIGRARANGVTLILSTSAPRVLYQRDPMAWAQLGQNMNVLATLPLVMRLNVAAMAHVLDDPDPERTSAQQLPSDALVVSIAQRTSGGPETVQLSRPPHHDPVM